MVLNGRKEAFAQAIFNGLEKKEACISAGYSKKTARQQAARLIKEPDVIERVKELSTKSDKGNKNVAGQPNNGDPKQFLLETMQDEELPIKVRLDAAKALMPYEYGRIGEKGKKETQEEIAEVKAKAGGLSARLAEKGHLKRVK